jgi:hypothetical protein
MIHTIYVVDVHPLSERIPSDLRVIKSWHILRIRSTTLKDCYRDIHDDIFDLQPSYNGRLEEIQEDGYIRMDYHFSGSLHNPYIVSYFIVSTKDVYK